MLVCNEGVAADHTRPKNTLSTKPTPFCTILPPLPPGGNESSIKRRYQCVTSGEFSRSLSVLRAVSPSLRISFSLLLSLSLCLSSFLPSPSSLARAFIARYLFRPPLAAKSRGDGKRRHENFVTVFSSTMKTSWWINECYIFRERERERGEGWRRERRVICIGVTVPALAPAGGRSSRASWCPV